MCLFSKIYNLVDLCFGFSCWHVNTIEAGVECVVKITAQDIDTFRKLGQRYDSRRRRLMQEADRDLDSWYPNFCVLAPGQRENVSQGVVRRV